MAKVKSGLFNKISGTVGDKTTFRTTDKIILQKKPIPTDKKTPKQLAQRLRYKQACQAWHKLTSEEKAQFEAIAKQKNITAFNAFLSYYLLQPPAPTEQIIFFDDFNEMPNSQVYDVEYYVEEGIYVENGLLIIPPSKQCWLDKTMTISPPFTFEFKFLLVDPSNSYFLIAPYITTENWDRYISITPRQIISDGSLSKWISIDALDMPFSDFVYNENVNFQTENVIKAVITSNNAKITLNNNEILSVDGEFTNTITGYIDIYLKCEYYSQHPLKLDYIKITKP